LVTEVLKFDKFNILGHSLGGMVALELGLLIPEKINKLFTLCTPYYNKKYINLEDFKISDKY